jgi:GTPase SAR1 family protein/Leucine-rich repeat (LRR) protein
VGRAAMSKIFISYSHEDKDWLKYIRSHLRTAEFEGELDLWDDRKLLGGDDWEAKIKDALAACSVCILLVSRHSLTSDYINRVEMRTALERAKSEGVRIYPIFVSSTYVPKTHWLKKFNWRPTDGRPLQSLSETTDERDKAMVAIVDEIVRLAASSPVSPPAAPGRASTVTSGEEPKAPAIEGLIEVSPDELNAWLERARREQWRHLAILGPDAFVSPRIESWPDSWRAAGRVFRLNAPIEAPPAKLLALTGLTSLDIPGNRIDAEGAKAIAASLTGLASLNLERNNIGAAGAKAIAASLKGLTLLDLRQNNIGAAGARALAASLTRLASLNLWSNNIGDEGARAIAAALTGLSSLELSNNNIGDVSAKAIAASLTRLASLDLGGNKIGDEGAKAIATSLTGLTSLSLWGTTNIGDAGARALAGSLTRLASLNLGGNKIGDAGAEAIAASLTALTSLLLWGNKIGDAGAKAIAASLTGLASLNIHSNNIGDAGAKAIAAKLTGLTWLDFSGNDIGVEGARAILDSWSARSDSLRLQSLELRGNGDLSTLLPKEALETADAQTILAAYRRFTRAQAQGAARPLNEVKLLVVGNEAVGKTSLLNFLIDGKRCNPDEKRTPGIAQREKIKIKAWSPDKSEVRLNVWDFGGQEMMRGTHRFFLTERSLYLLLFEDRREDERTIHDWLKTIRNRGSDSPILVVINKSDEGKQDLRLPEEQLAKDYPNIVGFLRTSCNPGDWAERSIAALRGKIVETIQNDSRLKHVRDPIPNNWLAIKNKVAEMAAKRALLNHSEFIALCVAPGEGLDPITDADEQRALLQVLHQLGVIVAHGLKRDAPAARREITLLDPNWLTEAIYGVLDKARSVEQEGEFLRAQLGEWLDPKRYPPERHEFILDMMLDPEIGLCFRLPLPKEERYLIPEGLSPNPPYLGYWPADCLRFRFQYKFLPPSLIPRFIVQANRHLTPEKARWRTGVVLKVRDCPGLVKADTDQRRIDIEVAGPPGMRRSALNVVLDDLEFVHGLNPEAEPMAYVPLPGDPKLQVRYDHLLMLESKKGPDHEFFPEGAEREYKVRELLDGVRRDEIRLRDGLRAVGRD